MATRSPTTTSEPRKADGLLGREPGVLPRSWSGRLNTSGTGASAASRTSCAASVQNNVCAYAPRNEQVATTITVIAIRNDQVRAAGHWCRRRARAR